MQISGPPKEQKEPQQQQQSPQRPAFVGRGIGRAQAQDQPAPLRRSAASATESSTAGTSHLEYMLKRMEMEDNLVEERGSYGERSVSNENCWGVL